MIFICVVQQMAEEPNCRNTEPHRAWPCSEGFLSCLTANLRAAAERGRAKGQQRSPKQLVNAPSSPSQESKGHSSKSIMIIIDCHSFRHWCVLLPLLQDQPAAERQEPAGMGPGARWRGHMWSTAALSSTRKHIWNFQVRTFVLQPSQGCGRKPGISAATDQWLWANPTVSEPHTVGTSCANFPNTWTHTDQHLQQMPPYTNLSTGLILGHKHELQAKKMKKYCPTTQFSDMKKTTWRSANV